MNPPILLLILPALGLFSQHCLEVLGTQSCGETPQEAVGGVAVSLPSLGQCPCDPQDTRTREEDTGLLCLPWARSASIPPFITLSKPFAFIPHSSSNVASVSSTTPIFFHYRIVYIALFPRPSGGRSQLLFEMPFLVFSIGYSL